MTQKQIIEQVIEKLRKAERLATMPTMAWADFHGALALLEQFQDSEAAAGMERMGFEKVEQVEQLSGESTKDAKKHWPMLLNEACDRLDAQQKEIERLKLSLCPLKGQLREAAETALWTIEKRKMQNEIDSLTTENANLLALVDSLRCSCERHGLKEQSQDERIKKLETFLIDLKDISGKEDIVLIERVLSPVSDAKQDGIFDDHEG